MNNEQLRAAFEAWRRKHYDYADLCAFEIEFAFDAFQAGRAALQAQDREGYAGVTVWMDGAQCTKIITRIQYESSSADELLRHFEAARAAIDHARRAEEGWDG